MGAITRFEEIEAWQTARRLANLSYELTESNPFAKDFGLKDQIRRAAVSVMSNIAEGFESHTQALFIDFLGRAKGSAGEVRSQLYLALDRHDLTQRQFDEAYRLAEQASRQIYRLMMYLKAQSNTTRVREDQIEYTTDG